MFQLNLVDTFFLFNTVVKRKHGWVVLNTDDTTKPAKGEHKTIGVRTKVAKNVKISEIVSEMALGHKSFKIVGNFSWHFGETSYFDFTFNKRKYGWCLFI